MPRATVTWARGFPNWRPWEAAFPSSSSIRPRRNFGRSGRSISEKGWGPLDPEVCVEICDYIIGKCKSSEYRFDLRLLTSAFTDYIHCLEKDARCHWQDLVDSTIAKTVLPQNKAEELELERQIALGIHRQGLNTEEKLRLVEAANRQREGRLLRSDQGVEGTGRPAERHRRTERERLQWLPANLIVLKAVRLRPNYTVTSAHPLSRKYGPCGLSPANGKTWFSRRTPAPFWPVPLPQAALNRTPPGP